MTVKQFMSVKSQSNMYNSSGLSFNYSFLSVNIVDEILSLRWNNHIKFTCVSFLNPTIVRGYCLLFKVIISLSLDKFFVSFRSWRRYIMYVIPGWSRFTSFNENQKKKNLSSIYTLVLSHKNSVIIETTQRYCHAFNDKDNKLKLFFLKMYHTATHNHILAV